MSKQHVKLSIGAAVIVASIVYLMFSGATGSTMYYMTVPELHHQVGTLQGEAVRVSGKVTADPIHWDVRNLLLTFTMGEGEASVPVSYKGIKPDMFKTGADVIVEGQIGQDGILVASHLDDQLPVQVRRGKTHFLMSATNW